VPVERTPDALDEEHRGAPAISAEGDAHLDGFK